MATLFPSDRAGVLRRRRSGTGTIDEDVVEEAENGPTSDPFRVLLGTLLGLILSALLASSSLVDIAERMEFGPDRNRWLAAARTLDGASHNLWLDRPADLIRGTLGYDADPNEVVVGTLALEDQPPEVNPPAAPGDAGTDDGVAAPALEPSATAADTPSVPQPVEDNAGRTVEPTGSEGTPPEAEAAPTDEQVTEPGDYAETAPAAAEPVALPALRKVTPDEPLRVWFGGDSLGQLVANHVAYRLAPPEQTEIETDYHISTGLARPDFFDWPAHFTEVIGDDGAAPEAFVFMVGGNDDQPMRLQQSVLDVLTPEWREEYGRRVGLVMDVVAYADTRLYWIQLPPMESLARNEISSVINQIVAEQAGQRPWVTLVGTADLLSADGATYTQFIDGDGGDRHLVRQNDGVHITDVGSRWIGERVWADLTDAWPGLG